jgi:catechol 2,3-dioxygenase-like lactoylglutathione lyase family enzyme
MITTINHVQVSVPPGSADEVRRFYGQILGLAEIPLPPAMTTRNLIWFLAGDTPLHVAFEDGINRIATRAHIAYEVSDIADWRQRLADHGIELFEQPLIEGYDRFHINDPFGNRIEIIGAVCNQK